MASPVSSFSLTKGSTTSDYKKKLPEVWHVSSPPKNTLGCRRQLLFLPAQAPALLLFIFPAFLWGATLPPLPAWIGVGGWFGEIHGTQASWRFLSPEQDWSPDGLQPGPIDDVLGEMVKLLGRNCSLSTGRTGAYESRSILRYSDT